MKYSISKYTTRAPSTEGFSWANGLALRLMLLLSIATLFQPYGPFSSVNRVIIALVVLALFVSFFQTRYPRVYWLALPLVGALVAYDMHVSSGQFMTANDPVYLPFWFLLLMVFSENNEKMDKLIRSSFPFIKAVALIWCILVGFSIFVPASYSSGWGGGVYFGSIPQSVWRLAPTACMVQVMLLFCLAYDRGNKDGYFLCSLIPLYCGFMGGSRTYFFIIALHFILFLYFYAENSRQFRLYLAPVLIAGIVAVGFTGIGSKIAATSYTNSSVFDYLGTVTNGRTLIWASDADYYLNAGITAQLLGSGYDAIYEINLASELNAAVYAHNDFVNVLICNGLFGLLVYLVPPIVMFRKFGRSFAGSKLVVLICVIIWIFNAGFNMTYTYTAAAIALALLPRSVMAIQHSRGISVMDSRKDALGGAPSDSCLKMRRL